MGRVKSDHGGQETKMAAKVYTTKTDAIDYAIEPALGEYASDFDMGAMFDELFEYDEKEGGFVERAGIDFFEVAQAHDITA